MCLYAEECGISRQGKVQWIQRESFALEDEGRRGGQSADLRLTCVWLTPLLRWSQSRVAEDIPHSLTHFPFFIVSDCADTDRRAAALLGVCVSMWCVWSATRVIMTDKRQAESQRTDLDHTHVLSFLFFCNSEANFFFREKVGHCSCNR